MAPVIHALERHPSDFSVVTCSTGQHHKMLGEALEDLNLSPDISLRGTENAGNLIELNSSLLAGMAPVLRDVRPDISLVHGDTATALNAGLASFYSNIFIGHVEAGLRTHNMQAPFPEEFNRRAITAISSVHFAPTPGAADNLTSEGVDASSILVTGNTVIDALFWTADSLRKSPELAAQAASRARLSGKFAVENTTFVLVTSHRRENLDQGIENLCRALVMLADRFPHVHFVWPVHLNPRVQKPVDQFLRGLTNIHLTTPLGYLALVNLMMQCRFVITDSGGIQEEAPSLGKPVLVLRDVTERPESVVSGNARVVGTQTAHIFEAAHELLTDEKAYMGRSNPTLHYGDGNAAERIVSHLREIRHR